MFRYCRGGKSQRVKCKHACFSGYYSISSDFNGHYREILLDKWMLKSRMYCRIEEHIASVVSGSDFK